MAKVVGRPNAKTSALNIERRGARGAADQLRFGKLNVIGVVGTNKEEDMEEGNKRQEDHLSCKHLRQGNDAACSPKVQK